MANVKMRNIEILRLFNMLSNLTSKGSAKFQFVLAKNRAVLKPHAEALNEVQTSFGKDDERVEAWLKRRDEILKEFAVTADGKPNMRELPPDGRLQRIVPVAKQGDYALALEALNEEFKDVVEKSDKFAEQMNELMQEEVDVGMRMIDLDEVPNNELAQADFNILMYMIKDPEEKKEKDLKRVK